MATVWVEVRGRKYKVELAEGAPAMVDGVPFGVDLKELEPGVLSLLWTDAEGPTRSFRCVADANAEGDAVVVNAERIGYAVYDPRSLRGTASAKAESGPKALKAPMPGRIVRVLVAAGETVEAGQGCVVMEAMKMQNELKAPKAGVVGRLAATVGETVTAGAVLLVVG
jgi:biotin carboxyl carrier protein